MFWILSWSQASLLLPVSTVVLYFLVSSEAKDLVKRMMDPNPAHRLSAKEALEHSWIVKYAGNTKDTSVTGHTGLNALSASLHQKDGACVIS